MAAFARAFCLTLLVEVPLYVAALTRGWRLPRPRALTAAVCVNMLTHPPLWWALASRRGIPMPLAELLVCLVEGLLLMLAARRADPLLLVLSLGVNAVSVLVGLIVPA